MGAIGVYKIVGVVDGSDAVPGTVGEFLYASNVMTGPWPVQDTNNAMWVSPVGSLVVSAGDWTVGGFIDQWIENYALPVGVSMYGWGWNYLGPHTDQYGNPGDWTQTDGYIDRAWTFVDASNALQNEQNMGPFRVNVATPTEIFLHIQVQTTGGVGQWGANWAIWARRMR